MQLCGYMYLRARLRCSDCCSGHIHALHNSLLHSHLSWNTTSFITPHERRRLLSDQVRPFAERILFDSATATASNQKKKQKKRICLCHRTNVERPTPVAPYPPKTLLQSAYDTIANQRSGRFPLPISRDVQRPAGVIQKTNRSL